MEVLMEKEAEDFLAKYEFPIVEREVFNDYEEALNYANKIGFPVVLKVHGILHKSEVHGVRLNVIKETFEEVFKELKKKTPSIMVQEFVEGKSVIIGLKKDATFGHAILFGLGGIFVEVLKDVSFRVCPIVRDDAKEMIKEIKGYEILEGVRGEKPVNFKKLEDILLSISRLVEKYNGIDELDINPLIINDKEAKIVDARIVFS